MKDVRTTKKFERDLRLSNKRGKNMSRLETIVTLLRKDNALPARCRPHKLSGDYEGFWECHVEPDWLLIYEDYPDQIVLTRLGTHSDLFD